MLQRPASLTRALNSLLLLALMASAAVGCAPASETIPPPGQSQFTVAMIPDTQNYVDYTHQKAQGFALDASEMFIEQMRWIAGHSRAQGGEIVFVAAVGDVWQHQSRTMDQEHAVRDIGRIEKTFLSAHLAPTPKTREQEIPKAIEGYQLISDAGLAFGVAPGNHDYDAMWSVDSFPPNTSKKPQELSWTPEDLGMLHVGGLDNFRSAFGQDSPFFKDRDWYIDSFRDGANSAQLFSAGGYRFLHIAIEMQADDAVLEWVASVLGKHPGLPTILTTHDYLNPRGERAANPIIDLDRVDPEHHNSAEELWSGLIARNDQIFMVLCGHHHGQALRSERNDSGHMVHQILADYQDRGQAGIDAGQPPDPFLRGPAGLGDGWLRLLDFDTSSPVPTVTVRTYSTHYGKLSGEIARYADWYRAHEQPQMQRCRVPRRGLVRAAAGGFPRAFRRPAFSLMDIARMDPGESSPGRRSSERSSNRLAVPPATAFADLRQKAVVAAAGQAIPAAISHGSRRCTSERNPLPCSRDTAQSFFPSPPAWIRPAR